MSAKPIYAQRPKGYRKVNAKDLRVGDKLSSGAEVIKDPYPETHPMYGKGKVRIGIRYADGHEKSQVWNARTVISVVDE